MADGEGNDKSYDRIEDLEQTYKSSMWKALADASEALPDEMERALAKDLFDSASLEVAAHKLKRLHRGTWVDNLLLTTAAVAGLVAGYKAQSWVDIRPGGVPATGLLGLAGAVPGLVMDRGKTARNVVGLGGAMFLAGAGLYTSGS